MRKSKRVAYLVLTKALSFGRLTKCCLGSRYRNSLNRIKSGLSSFFFSLYRKGWDRYGHFLQIRQYQSGLRGGDGQG